MIFIIVDTKFNFDPIIVKADTELEAFKELEFKIENTNLNKEILKIIRLSKMKDYEITSDFVNGWNKNIQASEI